MSCQLPETSVAQACAVALPESQRPAYDSKDKPTRLIRRIQQMCWVTDNERDRSIFVNFLRSTSQISSEAFDEIDRKSTQELFQLVRSVLRRLTRAKVSRISLERATTQSFDACSEAYTSLPTEAQRTLWCVIKEAFSPFNINARFDSDQFVQRIELRELNIHALNLVANKYIYDMPYTLPDEAILRKQYSWKPALCTLDPVLTKLSDYATGDRFCTWMKRTSMCTFLRPVDGDDQSYSCRGVHYVVSVPGDAMQCTDSAYYQHGVDAYFDKNLNYVGTNLCDDHGEFQRVLSSFMTWATWSVHLGLVHALVADEWNYHFCKSAGSDHALSPLVNCLMLGTSESMNLGSLLLANNIPSSIPAVVSNITPESVQRLMVEHHDNVRSILHFPTVKRLTDNVDTPMMRTLDMWWNALERYVEACVSNVYPTDTALREDPRIVDFLVKIRMGRIDMRTLTDAITMMHFNNVVHETYSNSQHTDDAIKVKHTWVCHKEHIVPSVYVQDRLIDLLVGTSGESVHYSTLHVCMRPDAKFKDAVDALRQDMENIAKKIDRHEKTYIRYLHPNCVACSITW
eukprot:gene8021-9530_t